MCHDHLTMTTPKAGDPTQQDGQTTPNKLNDRRHSFSEHDDGEFMKEEDAAILERGLRDSCSTGETPILTPRLNTKDVPVMVLDNLLEESEVSLSAHGDGRADKSSSPGFIESLDDAGALARSDHSKTKIAKARGYRRCLSGDLRSSRHGDAEEGTDASPESVIDEFHQTGAPSDSELKPCSSSFDEEEAAQIVRSARTMDRLMNEVTQYAEAVGELPPSDESQLPEIIEDEESDSDDSSEGVEVEGFDNERSIENEPPLDALNETRRSDSFERKLKEAAQYAEAVGEMPPSDEAEVREMIDDTVSCSDDDDSAEEVRIDNDTILPMPTTPPPKLAREPDEQDALGDETPIKPEMRKKSRPQWPFRRSENSSTFLHKLPDGVNTQDFVYKGICSNPPEVTKRGIQRGNFAQLHRKAWLEVSDKYHRYGKNLRLYYRYWEGLGFPHNSFFDWLDSKGEAAGNPLPNLEECPRSQLDSDTVLYITNPDVTEKYALSIIPEEGAGRGLVVDVDNDPVRTGSDGWIFVLRDNVVYGAQKITSVTGHSKQRFHHSSFFGGKAVAAAGILITDDDGYLTRLFPHSGHYRPGEADMQRMLFYLHHNGISLRTFDLDTQQIFHVNRETSVVDGEGKKKKKVDSLHPVPALYVASYLAHKAKFIDAGIFAQIHKIRKANVTSVCEALEEIDDGGIWKHGKDKEEKDNGGV